MAVHGPALLVVAPQPVGLRQGLEQLPPELQTLHATAHPQPHQAALRAMDLPAAALGIQKEVEQAARAQPISQGPQALLRLVEMVENPHRIDVIEGLLPRQIQQAALLDAQLPHLLDGTGAAGALAGQLEGTGADVDRQHRGGGVEVAEIVGAHPGAATGVEDAPGPRAPWGQGGQTAAGKRPGTVDAPAPVVPGGRAILEGIAGVGETVVEGTHHGGGGITGGHGCRVAGGSISCRGPERCKHLFIALRCSRGAAVGWPSPVRSRP